MVSPATRRGDNRGGGDRPPGDRRGGRGGRGRDREQRPRVDDSGGFTERVVHTRRISKVVKGGRRLRFNALVVVGDGQGHVGAGMGKALAIPDAVRKGNAVARRSTVTIPLKGSTIPHAISVRKGGIYRHHQTRPPWHRCHCRRRHARHAGVGRRSRRGWQNAGFAQSNQHCAGHHGSA